MKCQHCGRNDATFYFKSNVNGAVREVHLCQECAKELGFADRVRGGFRPMNLFSTEDFFGRAFDPFAPLLGGLGTRLLTEFPSPVEEERPTGTDLVSGEEQEKLQRQRQKNALEARLKAAIEVEDYETAAKIRDELKNLPQ